MLFFELYKFFGKKNNFFIIFTQFSNVINEKKLFVY